MTFRIEKYQVDNRAVLQIHGQLVGRDAERVLREQIARAVADQGHVVVDVSEMTVFDPGCLAVIEAGLGQCLDLQGGGAYLELLLQRK